MGYSEDKQSIILSLREQIFSILLGGETKAIDPELRKHIKLAKDQGDDEFLAQLWFLRGEYYLRISKSAKAAIIFRRVLRSGFQELEAMIGIAESYFQCKQEDKAKEWLDKALSYAQERSDYEGHLEVMDTLAWRAAVSGDNSTLADLLKTMSSLVTNVPRGSRLATSTVDMLLERDRGAECINYLECCLERLLTLNVTYVGYGSIVYLLANAYRQADLDNETVRERLLRYKEHIADDAIAAQFISRVDRDISRRPYRTLEEMQHHQNHDN